MEIMANCDIALKLGMRKCFILMNCHPFQIYCGYIHFKRLIGNVGKEKMCFPYIDGILQTNLE